jgi:hypothetical protein
MVIDLPMRFLRRVLLIRAAYLNDSHGPWRFSGTAVWGGGNVPLAMDVRRTISPLMTETTVEARTPVGEVYSPGLYGLGAISFVVVIHVDVVALSGVRECS